MRLPKLSTAIVFAIVLWLLSSGTAYAVEQTDTGIGMSPTVFCLLILGVSILIGVIAVLGGVGGGVVFTPLMMGFTPVDSYIIRAMGLLIALVGSLVAARPFLRRGLANIRILFFVAVPYSAFAIVGALMAGYVKATAGEFGESLIRLVLGILVVFISLLILFGGKRVEYPEVKNVDSLTKRLALGMAYWEASLGKVVDYKVTRSPIGVMLICVVGLVSGLFGLGAGWAMVPVFNLVMLVPLKVAAASSKVLIGIGDTAAVWPYIMSGAIFPLFAVPSMIGMVIGTSIGARIMLVVKAASIRWLIIAVMLGTGAKLVFDGISRLGRM